ncbi:MAG: ArsR family transcriptional regulator [Methanobacteriota archaeon]|nr:MAG: ArsR family transcriptional regulator [Euryarchaeota archaeon]
MNLLCQTTAVDVQKVQELRKEMPEEDSVRALSRIFRVLGDPTKAKILYALSRSELCVCEISALLGLTQSAVSHQLRVLKDLNLVRFRREKKMLYYSLADRHVYSLIDQTLSHVTE